MVNSDNLSLQKYRKKLSEANLKESTDPQKTLNLLSECVQILDEDANLQDIKPRNYPTLQKRISFLEKRLNLSKKQNQTTTGSPPTVIVMNLSDTLSPINDGVTTPIVKTVELVTIPPNPDIIHNVYQNLKNNQNISYEDYLNFYQQLNIFHPDPFSPVIYQEGQRIYYVGDTHGSYDEANMMIHYFETILTKDPSVLIVFLGDYVDRNPKDLENVTIIFGFYFKFHDNVVILRGNHEDRTINEDYGFLNNLNSAFKDPKQVESLYNEILKFFIKLPVVQVNQMQDQSQQKTIRILAVHGGIPVDVDNPEVPIDLHIMEKEIKSQIESYKKFDRYMNWLLWADPKEEIPTIIYDPFTGRSQFGPTAFEQFLQKNQLDLMIRAHEKWTEGVKMYFNDKLTSLFSTSYYNGVRIGTGKFLYIESGKQPHLFPLDEEILKKDLENFK